MLIWKESVRPEWIDYNGHLSEAYYVLVFGHATDAVMEQIGLGEQARAANSSSLFTVEAHIRYLDQISEGEELEVRSTLVGSGTKKLHMWHEMWAGGRLRATEEILGLHVDTDGGRTTPFPPDVVDLINAQLTAPPEHSGRSIHV
ncbi:thioesterase family protein [Nocardioides sp.]|uniref:thioesterase family protein n=1 Tax=Nocardioides sp. TaxID=35761 RepID=UPI003D0DA342